MDWLYRWCDFEAFKRRVEDAAYRQPKVPSSFVIEVKGQQVFCWYETGWLRKRRYRPETSIVGFVLPKENKLQAFALEFDDRDTHPRTAYYANGVCGAVHDCSWQDFMASPDQYLHKSIDPYIGTKEGPWTILAWQSSNRLIFPQASVELLKTSFLPYLRTTLKKFDDLIGESKQKVVAAEQEERAAEEAAVQNLLVRMS